MRDWGRNGVAYASCETGRKGERHTKEKRKKKETVVGSF